MFTSSTVTAQVFVCPVAMGIGVFSVALCRVSMIVGGAGNDVAAGARGCGVDGAPQLTTNKMKNASDTQIDLIISISTISVGIL
jgi:hypothetical protein